MTISLAITHRNANRINKNFVNIIIIIIRIVLDPKRKGHWFYERDGTLIFQSGLLGLPAYCSILFF